MKNTGFTLVETMVAITILTVAVSGAFVSANSALVAANIARDRLTASYLAQEGIEYVRWMRDNKYLEFYPNSDTPSSVLGPAWTNFLTGSISGCSSSCEPTSLGLTTVIPSSFIRSIQATVINANDEKIVSKVSWTFHNSNYSVIITDHLTPWQ